MGFKDEFGFESASFVPDEREFRGETVLSRYVSAIEEFKESGEQCVKMDLGSGRIGLELSRWRNAARKVGGVIVSKRDRFMYLSLGDPNGGRSTWQS